MQNFIHPEKAENEIFFTNCSLWQFNDLKYKTKRKGSKAYDGYGNQLDLDDWFPVFIQEKELVTNNLTLSKARNLFRENFKVSI